MTKPNIRRDTEQDILQPNLLGPLLEDRFPRASVALELQTHQIGVLHE